MENLVAKGGNILKREGRYHGSPTHVGKGHQAANTGEETNTLTMILITLAMIVLTFAVITKVFTLLVSGLMSLIKSQLGWLRLQH